MKTSSKIWLRDMPVFAALFAVMGLTVVPARVDNMWYDPDFTGWVAPLARRLAEGQTFYTDGAHFPMPPLAFVLMRLLFGANQTWFDESLLNFLLQCGIVLLGYAALTRWLPRPLPLVAALAAAGYYFALPKSIAYDTLAEFIAAAAIAAASFALHDPKRKIPFLVWGLCLPALALTKQTTFIGLVAGTAATMGFALASQPSARRKEILTWFGIGLVAGPAVFGALVTPWMSWGEFMQDAYLGSRELKAPGMSSAVFFQYAYRYGFAIVGSGLLPLACLYLAAKHLFPTKHKAAFDPLPAAMPGLFQWLGPAAAAIAIIICLTAPLQQIPGLVRVSRSAGTWDFLDGFFIPAGFALVTVLIVRALTGKRDELARFGLLCLLALSTAVIHNLSQPAQLRLSYDNNTVVMLAVAALLSLFIATVQHVRLPPRAVMPALTACCFIVTFCGWLPMAGEMLAVRAATESFPEIPYLAGAKMNPSAEGLRDLAATVTKNTKPSDTVLLLPEDPDLESWWNRPRPALAGAIVFTDQYRMRFVEGDIKTLEHAPPKIIIIGPRGKWLEFSSLFGSADAALVLGIQKQLLPRSYRLLKAQPITFRGKPDFMDVYIRRE